eukprot:9220754-Pyramimonas_sp.AAC.1
MPPPRSKPPTPPTEIPSSEGAGARPATEVRSSIGTSLRPRGHAQVQAASGTRGASTPNGLA